ncbi:hypothetical protein J4Q44_G00021980 [Coregonus suidteri]|uniref:Ig-like domain-containing protein n=1 Tax=Coregonus suidteri TaxID=861788 RepID=A0AAN8R751_9TELE
MVTHSLYHQARPHPGTVQLWAPPLLARWVVKPHAFSRSKVPPPSALVPSEYIQTEGVQLSDQGQYTCDVTDEQGSTKEKLLLLVAAPFKEPQLSVQSSCDSFFITLKSSQGFPQPKCGGQTPLEEISPIRATAVLAWTAGGRYEGHSSMEVKPNSTLTIIC